MGDVLKITGYHGTSADSAKSILDNGYSLSAETEWFGAGVYFFEDCAPFSYGIEEAKWWVTKRNYDYWVILQSSIESDNYLDIAFCREHRDRFEKAKEAMIRKYENSGKNLNDFKLRTVFIMLSKSGVDLIRACVDAQLKPRYT